MNLRDTVTFSSGAWSTTVPAQVGVSKVERLIKSENTEALTHDESLRCLVSPVPQLESLPIGGISVVWRGQTFRIAPVPGIQISRQAGRDHHMTLTLVRYIAP